MGIHRSALRRRNREDAATTKLGNRDRKAAERTRRNDRMVAKLKSGSLPYSPSVMSWLSRELAKPAGKITQDDIKSITG
ncbi:MAG: hypothetical protein ACYTHJ_15825 [Planctomycetota bacterium]|jgi:hypothetical protein